MKKVILSLVFVLATSISLVNAFDKDSNILEDGPSLEYCDNFATEMAGFLAIVCNNSFEEEDEDYVYLLGFCMDEL